MGGACTSESFRQKGNAENINPVIPAKAGIQLIKWLDDGSSPA